MLGSLKIIHKNFLMGFTQLLLILLVGWFGLTQMFKIGAEITQIAHENIPLAAEITELTEHQLLQEVAFEKLVSHELYDALENHPNSKETLALRESLKTKLTYLHDEIAVIKTDIKNLLDNAHNDVAEQKYSQFYNEIRDAEKSFYLLEADTFEFIKTIEGSGIKAALGGLKQLETSNHLLDEKLVQLLKTVQEFSLESANQAEADELEGIKIISTILIISVIIAAILPVVIGRSIINPIKHLQSRIEEISNGDGDLTQRINNKSRDEVGDVSNSFDHFMNKLQSIIQGVNNSSSLLSGSSNQANDVIKNALKLVDAQREEMTTAVNSMTEMSQATDEVAKNTINAAEIAQGVQIKVLEGKESATEIQSIIQSLSNDVESARNDISALVEETNNIGMVLETIQSIAEQTNLLALNAAIEAARAGETGRGFAVVADEVRSLAQRTQSSTVDIQALVENLQKEATNAMKSMDKGSEVSKECLQKSMVAADIFDGAAAAVSQISDVNAQIAAAAEEQSAVAHEMQNNLQNINNLASKTTAETSSAAQANDDIEMRLTDLNVNLSQFKA